MTDRLNGERNGRSSRAAPANRWAQAMLSTRKGSLSWADVGAEDLLAAVARVTEDGAAVLLAKTSDGGALMLQILAEDGQKPKHYAASMAEVNEVLEALAHA